MRLHTVNGVTDGDSTGMTMIHEHLIFDLTGVRKDEDSRLREADVIEEVMQLRQSGCGLMVEVTNIGMGRNPLGLLSISRRTGMDIVASTGFYKEVHYPSYVFDSEAERLADLFVREIEEGMEGTAIKAGLIAEIGSSLNEITPAEDKVFRAAVSAHRATGAPISTHCEIGTMGSEQLALVEKHGANLSKVSFGHQDLNENLEEQRQLLRSGAYLQFDTIGKISYRSDEDRALNLVRLLEDGFENRIMLSCDITRQSHLRKFGGHGYHYLFDSFIPLLKRYGVTDNQLQRMLVINPRAWLSF